ncbi:MAG: 1-acyl-sn-glycerol-3-phosphate acyltransferase [Sphingobacteriales bacterium]|jgi:1-acyl-sn-glycerol-3-phosphate acyltransferase
MLYWFLYIISKPGTWLFNKTLVIRGKKNIPKNKPILFASNHPNSFLDAVNIAMAEPKGVYFLVRGDMMSTPITKLLYGAMHQIPIFRRQEGYENLKQNDKTFDICYDLLKKNGRIIIFAEGVGIAEKRIRPIKKGAARMALDALERSNGELDVHIVPTTLNYNYPTVPGKGVYLNFEEPIRVKDYEASFKNHPAIAKKEISEAIEKALKPKVIHYNLRDIDLEYDTALDLLRNNVNKKNHSRELELFNVDLVNLSFGKDTKNSELAKNYAEKLKSNKALDMAVNKGRLKLSWLLLPFFLISWVFDKLGYLLNCPSNVLGNKIAKGVKATDFIPSIKYLVTTFGYFLYLVILLAIFGTLGHWIIIPIILLLGIYSIFARNFNATYFNRLKLSFKVNILNELQEIRAKLVETLDGN